MSSEKKFRIQNGLDVAGEVLVNGINIVGADGVLNQASYQTAVQAMIDATVAQGVDQNSIDTAVSTAVAALADSAPETLDTLNELAAALGDDADFATSMTNALNTKLTAANNLSDVADAAAARSNLGLGTAATAATTSFATAAQGTKADNAATQADLDTLQATINAGVATAAQGTLADTAVQPEDFSTGISTVNTSTANWGDNTWTPSFTSLSNSDFGNNPPRVKTSPNGNVIALFSDNDGTNQGHKVVVWDSAGNELYDETFTTSQGSGTNYSRADVDISDTHYMYVSTVTGARVVDISTGTITFNSEGPTSSAGIDAGLQFVYGYLEGNYVVFTFGSSSNGLYADGIKVYDWTNGSLVSTYNNNNTIYFVVESGYAYLNDGNSIKKITLSDGSDTTLIGTNALHNDSEGRNLAVTSEYLITGGGNVNKSGGVRIRDINTGNILHLITPPTGANGNDFFGSDMPRRGNISANGNTLAISYKPVSGSGNAIYIFDISSLGASTSADNYQQIISGSHLVSDNVQTVLNHTITDDQKFILAFGTEGAGSQFGGPNISITPGPVSTVTTFEVDDSLFATRAYADSAVAGVDLTNYSNTIAMNTAIATAKSEAISTASADATTKADAAQAAAEAFATTAAANAAAGVVDSAPEALDTLNELAAALGDDANFATTVTNSLASKASSADLSTTQSEVTALQDMVGTQTYEAFGTVTGGSAVALTSTGKVTQISSNIPDMNETYTTLGTNVDKKAMMMGWDSVNNQLIVFSAEKPNNYAAEKLKISAVTPDPMSLETTVHYTFQSASSSNSNGYVFHMPQMNSRSAIMAVIPGTAYYVLVNAERDKIVLFHNNGSSISQVSISTFDRAQQNYFYHAIVDGELHLFYKQNGVGWGAENNNNVMGTKVSVYNGNLVLGTEYTLYSAASNQSDFETYFFGTYQSNKIMPDRTTVETIDGQDWMFMLHGSQTEHWQKITAMKVDVSNEQLSFGDAKQHSYASRTSGNYHVDDSVGDSGQAGGWISYSAYSGNIVVPMKSGSSNTYIRAMVLEFDSGGDLVEKAFISPLISDQGNQNYNSIAVATSSLSDTVTFMYGRSYYGDNGWGYVFGSIDSSGSWTEIEKWRGGAHTYSDTTNGGSTAYVVFDGPELNGHSIFLRNNTSGSNSGTGIEVKAHVSRMTPVSNTAQWIGIATSTQTDGENVQVAIKNSSTTVLTGLSVGSTYYVQDDGSVTTTESDYIAGLALTSGKLLLEGADLSPYATTAELAATLSQAQAYADSASSVAATGVDFSSEIAAARSGAVADVAASDLDMGGNKVLFGNVYSTLADLPSATTYHGMFAHVHETGKGYFAHAGNWVELANAADLIAQSDIDAAVANLVDTAPDSLNTLNELAAALGDDANFASTVTASLADKADSATVTAALADKADSATVTAALADKADVTYVNSEIAGLNTTIANINVTGDVTAALTNYSTTAQMNTAISTSLSDYSTTTQMNTAISTAVDGVLDSAPGTLDTLNELAAALGDDPNFATSITTSLASKADASAVATSAQGTLADTAVQPEDLTTGFGTSVVTSPDFGGSYTTNVVVPNWDDSNNSGFSGYGFQTIRSNSTYYLTMGSYTSYNPYTQHKKLKLFLHSDNSLVWSKDIADTRQIAMNETHAAIAESDGVKIYDMAGNLVNTITTAGGFTTVTNQGMEFFGDNGLLLGDGYPSSNWQTTGRVFAVNYLTGQDLGTINLPVTQYSPNNGISETTMFAVSPDQSKVYIGDWRGSPSPDRHGRVYVADLSTFTVTDTIENPNPSDEEDFGISVAVNNDYLVVARNNKGGSNNASRGALEVFNVSDLSHVGTLTHNPTSIQGVQYGVSQAFPHKLAVAQGSNYVFASIADGSNKDDIKVTNLDDLSQSFFLETNQSQTMAGPSVVIRGSDVIAFGNGKVARFTANEGTTTTSFVVDDSVFATKAYVDSGVAGIDLSGYSTTVQMNTAITTAANAAEAAAIASASVTSTTKADAAEAAAIAAAATDATTKADAAQAAAIAAAATDATTKANAAQSAAETFATNAATTAVANVIDTAPDSLNTLNELAAALGDDANFASTVTAALANKADSTTVSAVSTVANSALQPADAAGLSVDDADKLDGQHGTHYRINIYDANGTLVN